MWMVEAFSSTIRSTGNSNSNNLIAFYYRGHFIAIFFLSFWWWDEPLPWPSVNELQKVFLVSGSHGAIYSSVWQFVFSPFLLVSLIVKLIVFHAIIFFGVGYQQLIETTKMVDMDLPLKIESCNKPLNFSPSSTLMSCWPCWVSAIARSCSHPDST